MIRDFEFFHGAALARLVHAGGRLTMGSFREASRAAYVVNDECGLYLKHSSSRMSPWQFTFLRRHQDEVDRLRVVTERLVVGFVCNDDGVVGLTYSELRMVLDSNFEEIEGVSISRSPRGMYIVRGRDGEMRYRVAEGYFIRKVLGVRQEG